MLKTNGSNRTAVSPLNPGSQALPVAAGAALLILLCLACHVVGDEVRLQNGDRYLGQVLTLDSKTLVLQSEVLGTLRLPRAKVSAITLGPAGVGTNPTPAREPQPGAATDASKSGVADAVASLGSLGADSNVVSQIQAQLLGSGGAEANAKFKEILGGYMSGRLSVSDIRAQAQAATDQIKQLKGELGDEAGGMLDGYLTILEKFLDEAKPPGGATNSTRYPGASKVKPGPASPGNPR